jgi:hypothetical protein
MKTTKRTYPPLNACHDENRDKRSKSRLTLYRSLRGSFEQRGPT